MYFRWGCFFNILLTFGCVSLVYSFAIKKINLDASDTAFGIALLVGSLYIILFYLFIKWLERQYEPTQKGNERKSKYENAFAPEEERNKRTFMNERRIRIGFVIGTVAMFIGAVFGDTRYPVPYFHWYTVGVCICIFTLYLFLFQCNLLIDLETAWKRKRWEPKAIQRGSPSSKSPVPELISEKNPESEQIATKKSIDDSNEK